MCVKPLQFKFFLYDSYTTDIHLNATDIHLHFHYNKYSEKTFCHVLEKIGNSLVFSVLHWCADKFKRM